MSSISFTTLFPSKPILENITKVEVNRISYFTDLGASNEMDTENGKIKHFKKIITGDTTFTLVNAPPADTSSVFMLELVNAGSHVLTFPTNIIFDASSAPTFLTTGRDFLVFVKRVNSTNYICSKGMAFSKFVLKY